MRLFGSEFVVDSCIALYEQEQRQEVWRIYIANGVKILTENTATHKGAKALAKSYTDLFKPVDNRTGDEVAADVIKKCRLKIKRKESANNGNNAI